MSEALKKFRKAVKPILQKHKLDYLFELKPVQLFELTSVTLLNFKEQDLERYSDAREELLRFGVELKYRLMI